LKWQVDLQKLHQEVIIITFSAEAANPGHVSGKVWHDFHISLNSRRHLHPGTAISTKGIIKKHQYAEDIWGIMVITFKNTKEPGDLSTPAVLASQFQSSPSSPWLAHLRLKSDVVEMYYS